MVVLEVVVVVMVVVVVVIVVFVVAMQQIDCSFTRAQNLSAKQFA